VNGAALDLGVIAGSAAVVAGALLAVSAVMFAFAGKETTTEEAGEITPLVI